MDNVSDKASRYMDFLRELNNLDLQLSISNHSLNSIIHKWSILKCLDEVDENL